MEQLNADIMIGPLSGDESIAIANYAKQHPTKTFVDGAAGAQDTTLKVRAPNFFRFNGDGAQWNAGLGDIAYNKLHWRKAAVVSDDYSFGWTSTAGFIADFCAAGGQMTQRVFPPLNTTDYSSYAQQISSNVDGVFVAVGGSGLIPFLKAYEQAQGADRPQEVHRQPVLGYAGPVRSARDSRSPVRTPAAPARPATSTPPRRRTTPTRSSGMRSSTIPPAAPRLRRHRGRSPTATTSTRGACSRAWRPSRGHRRRPEGAPGGDREGVAALAVRHGHARRRIARRSSPSSTSSCTSRTASWRSRPSARCRTSPRRSAARSRPARRRRAVPARPARSGRCRGSGRKPSRRSSPRGAR